MNLRVIAQAVPNDRYRRQAVSMLAFMSAALAALWATNAFGQQAKPKPANPTRYDVIPLKAPFDKENYIKKLQRDFKTFASNPSADEDTQNNAGRYISYVTARMTQADGLPEINERVGDITKGLDQALRRGNSQVVGKLMPLFAKRMYTVAKGNYQPAARVAATMALGKLNENLGDGRSRPPKPYRGMLGGLVNLYRDTNNPDGVRAAALHGLHRHVVLTANQMAAGNKKGLLKMMAGLLDEPAPQGRPAEAHAYLQRYAVNIMDALAPDTPAVATKLVSLSSDRSRPSLIALYSVEKFGRSGGSAKAEVESPLNVLDEWTVRALRAFEDEAYRLEYFYKRPPVAAQPNSPEDTLIAVEEKPIGIAGGEDMMEMGSGYGGDEEVMGEDGGMQGYGQGMDEGMDGEGMDGTMGMFGAPQEYKPQSAEVVATRRRLNQVMQQIHIGVTGTAEVGKRGNSGLLSVADDTSKAEISRWLTEFEAVLERLNDRSLEETNAFLDELKLQVEALEKLAGDAAKERAVAEPAADPPAADQPGDLAAQPGGDAALVSN